MMKIFFWRPSFPFHFRRIMGRILPGFLDSTSGSHLPAKQCPLPPHLFPFFGTYFHLALRESAYHVTVPHSSPAPPSSSLSPSPTLPGNPPPTCSLYSPSPH